MLSSRTTSASRILVAHSPSGKARPIVDTLEICLIAGEALGAKAVVDTRTPIICLHYTLQPGARLTRRVPPDSKAFTYVMDGEEPWGAGARRVTAGHMVLFGNDGDHISLAATERASLHVLLIAGLPLHEPVVRYGPFVMNTRAESVQAIEDYQKGQMGQFACP